MDESEIHSRFEKRQHMHDVPTTAQQVWDSYRETLQSRARSRAREYSHIPFDWHKDQSLRPAAPTAGPGPALQQQPPPNMWVQQPQQEPRQQQQQQQQQQMQQQQQQMQQQQHYSQQPYQQMQAPQHTHGILHSGQPHSQHEQQQQNAQGQHAHVHFGASMAQQGTSTPREHVNVPVKRPPRLAVEKVNAALQGEAQESAPPQQQAIPTTAAPGPQATRSTTTNNNTTTTSSTRSRQPMAQSLTAKRLYEISKQPKAPTEDASQRKPRQQRKNVRVERKQQAPKAAREQQAVAQPQNRHPHVTSSRQNYFGYKPTSNVQSAPRPAQQQQRPTGQRQAKKPQKKTKRPPFAFYGWNNDQLGAWQNKKTFNVRASKEVDVHALHAALDRGYIRRLPKHAQKEWEQPLHSHPFDYEQYERESGRVHDDVANNNVVGIDPSQHLYPHPQHQQQQQQSPPMFAHGPRVSRTAKSGEAARAQHKPHLAHHAARHQAAQWAARDASEQGDDGEEDDGTLEQHALTVTFESERSRNEAVQTDESFFHRESEAVQTGGNADAPRDERPRIILPSSSAQKPQQQQQQQQQGGRATTDEELRREQAAIDRQVAKMQIAGDGGAHAHVQQALTKADQFRQRQALESEYRRSYGDWYHQMLLNQGKVPQAQQQQQRPVVLDAHRPQVVERRAAPRYFFDRREEEDMFRVHYGAAFTSDYDC